MKNDGNEVNVVCTQSRRALYYAPRLHVKQRASCFKQTESIQHKRNASSQRPPPAPEANVKKEISPSESDGEETRRKREGVREGLKLQRERETERRATEGGREKHWAFCARIRTRSRRPTSFSGRVKEKERREWGRRRRRAKLCICRSAGTENQPDTTARGDTTAPP